MLKVKVGPVTARIDLRREWRADIDPILHKEMRGRLGLELNARSIKYRFHSISHAPRVGGFALSNAPVGFDVESLNRNLSRAAFERISEPGERAFVSKPIYLWVMKEAAWKSYRGHNQPKTIAEVEITSVRKLSRGKRRMFTFTGFGYNGIGVVINRSGLAIAVAILELS